MLTTLPPRLWAGDWRPLQYSAIETFFLFEIPRFFFKFVGQQFERIHESDGALLPALEIQSSSIPGMVEKLRETLGDALEQQDFTKILAPDRHFLLCVSSLLRVYQCPV